MPHGTKYHVFVYAHKNSKWIAEIRSLSYLPAPFFLQEDLVLIPEMQEVDIPGTPQKQHERTGRFTVVDMDSGNARTLNLNGGTPIRAIGGDIVVFEPYTGKAQRVLKVSWDISTAEVLYVTSGDWWQGYCLDSDVRTESFTLSAPQEANP